MWLEHTCTHTHSTVLKGKRQSMFCEVRFSLYYYQNIAFRKKQTFEPSKCGESPDTRPCLHPHPFPSVHVRSSPHYPDSIVKTPASNAFDAAPLWRQPSVFRLSTDSGRHFSSVCHEPETRRDCILFFLFFFFSPTLWLSVALFIMIPAGIIVTKSATDSRRVKLVLYYLPTRHSEHSVLDGQMCSIHEHHHQHAHFRTHEMNPTC